MYVNLNCYIAFNIGVRIIFALNFKFLIEIVSPSSRIYTVHAFSVLNIDDFNMSTMLRVNFTLFFF